MIWVYVEDVDRFVEPPTWSNFGAVFSNVWAASAFKGAFGERMFSVNVQRHAANQATKTIFLFVAIHEPIRDEIMGLKM